METILDILGNIGFDWRVALANLVNFIIIFFLLTRFAFRPLQKKIDERNSRIKKGLTDAEKAKKELETAEESYETRVNEGKKEAQAIITEAREQEKRIIEQAEKRGEEKAQTIVEAKEKALKEKERQVEEAFNDRASRLIVSAASKVLEREVDEEKNRDIISQFTHTT